MQPDVGAYARASDLRARAAVLLQPPSDITTSQAAERYRVLDNPGGGYSGPWRNAVTPYLPGPMDALDDPTCHTVVLMAPAQTGKSEVPLNWLAKSIVEDPADFQLVLDEKDQAEDFRDRRIKKLINASPKIGERLIGDKQYFLQFRGMAFNLAWPTGSKAASKPVPRNALDEFDSMPEDVDGEGDPYQLFRKRSQTFGAAAKTYVSSSPKRTIRRGAPRPAGPHEAPAATGIAALYNSGTRERYYWPCTECGEFFTPEFSMLQWPVEATGQDEAIPVDLACPHCGGLIGETNKPAMNRQGRWLAEGLSIDTAGRVTGQARRSGIRSFWLKGVAAAFMSWSELVRKHLAALEELDRLGTDSALKTWTQTDLGEPYAPPAGSEYQPLDPVELAQRAADFPLGVVPDGVRFLTASVDVQGNRFEAAVWGWGEQGEAWIVDWFQIVGMTSAGQPVLVGPAQEAAIAGNTRMTDPGGRLEDWDALTASVVGRVYRLASDPAHGMAVLATAVDSGGVPGVTANAYAWSRKLRQMRIGDARAFLIKGETSRSAPRLSVRSFEAKEKTRKGASRAGVRLWHVNVNLLKDDLDARLRRSDPGPRALHLSASLPQVFFDQLCVEQRDGEVWKNPAGRRQEAWDLGVYNIAAWLRLGAERINWSDPAAVPRWARREADMLVRLDGQPATSAGAAAATPPVATPAIAPGGGLLQRMRRRSDFRF